MVVSRGGRELASGRIAVRTDGMAWTHGAKARVLDTARYLVQQVAYQRCGGFPVGTEGSRAKLHVGRRHAPIVAAGERTRAAARAPAHEFVRPRVVAPIRDRRIILTPLCNPAPAMQRSSCRWGSSRVLETRLVRAH